MKRDWYDLFIEIHPENSSVNPNDESNGKPYYHMTPLKSDNLYYYSANTISTAKNWGGYATSNPLNDGFNMLPAGGVTNTGNNSAHFGNVAYYWTNVEAPGTSSYPAILFQYHSTTTTSMGLISPGWISVRCVKDEALTLNRKELVIGNNSSSTALAAITSPASLAPSVRWRSSDPSIASVDAITGAITTYNVTSTVDIIAYIDYEGVRQETACLIKVGAFSLTNSVSSISYMVDTQVPEYQIANDINLMISPYWASILDIEWSVDNDFVLSIDKKTGAITTLSPGMARVSFTIGTNSGVPPVTRSVDVEVIGDMWP